MNLDRVMEMIGEWGGTLKFFPGDEDARIGIAKKIAAFASTEDQVEWLVSRVADLYTEWPGILEIRAVFCTRFKPRDGVEAVLGAGSPAFAVLCPEDEERKALESALGRRQLTGEVAKISADPEMQDLVRKVAVRYDPLRGVKPATEDEIARIKAEQDRNRKESVSA
jgi:hypothetical protein